MGVAVTGRAVEDELSCWRLCECNKLQYVFYCLLSINKYKHLLCRRQIIPLSILQISKFSWKHVLFPNWATIKARTCM